MNEQDIKNRMTIGINGIDKIGNPDNLAPEKLHSLIDNLRMQITEALTFYSQYHQNPVNQKIHTVCIPAIMWTTMVWLSEIPAWPTDNLTEFLAIGYFLGYCLYDPKLGAVSGVLLAAFTKSAQLFAENAPHPNTTALALHVMAWIAQIYGHSKFEGNRPALLTSLGQSLYIAPLFSLIEACGLAGINLKTDKKGLLSSVSMFKSKRLETTSTQESIADDLPAVKKMQ